MKVYEKLFNENLGAIKRIQELREYRRKLEREYKESKEIETIDIWSILDEIGDNADMETLEFSLLIQSVDEAYYNKPFAHIRKQGKEKFYQLVNEYLNQ